MRSDAVSWLGQQRPLLSSLMNSFIDRPAVTPHRPPPYIISSPERRWKRICQASPYIPIRTGTNHSRIGGPVIAPPSVPHYISCQLLLLLPWWMGRFPLQPLPHQWIFLFSSHRGWRFFSFFFRMLLNDARRQARRAGRAFQVSGPSQRGAGLK